MSGNGTVFVVDDDAAVLEHTTALLCTAGFETRVFDSAIAFLDSFIPTSNACLLVDMKVLGMDALALQRELAARQIEIPSILMVSRGHVKLAVEAMKAGAIDVLEKPLRYGVIIDSIREVLASPENS